MTTLSLAGKWKLSQKNKKILVDANVPGDNYSALLAAGKIPDPYKGLNEDVVQWVHELDWEYSRTFRADKALLDKAVVFLTVESLDTFGHIYINGKEAGKTENMFRRYRFDVKKLLRAGENEIKILIESPSRRAAGEAEKSPELTMRSGHHKAPHMNNIRKSACHAGWDWGISLITSGIYGEISLSGSDFGRIEYVYEEQTHLKNLCKVTVITEYEAAVEREMDWSAEFDGKKAKRKVSLHKGLNIIRDEFEVKNPRLWWPAGAGEQNLYELKITTPDGTLSKNIGLRKIELVREKDEVGETFFFRVNGADIFCKGANWIPADAMTERITKDVYERLVGDAVNANMNMLRVWGGGQYEPETFYDICDRKGILIWHDMMFACFLYPVTKEFLENVKAEVTHQVKRLRVHACLALWCGDNENTGSVGWYGKTPAEKERNLLNYAKLNHELELIAEAHAGNGAAFWPSSPCNGYLDSGDGWNDDTRGDMHHWSVFDKGKLFDAYRSVKPRFCSEFGFQSMPALKTLKKVVAPDQLNYTSPEMEKHQKCNYATKRVLEIFASYFRMPESFESTVWLSQLQQALVLKNAVEYWRSLTPRCMGALYWQINDNWPVFSWATVDYFGNWKQAHYHAKRFFAPVIVTALQDKDGNLTVTAVNDTQEKLDAEVTVSVFDFNGKKHGSHKIGIVLPKVSAKTVKTFKVADLAPKLNERFMMLEIKACGKSGKEFNHRNEHFFTDYKACALPKAETELSARTVKGKTQISLKTDKPAFFVTLEPDGRGVFSDNSITLLPGETRVLDYSGDKIKKLVVSHLRDTYN
jgi:beta-mannosidase